MFFLQKFTDDPCRESSYPTPFHLSGSSLYGKALRYGTIWKYRAVERACAHIAARSSFENTLESLWVIRDTPTPQTF